MSYEKTTRIPQGKPNGPHENGEIWEVKIYSYSLPPAPETQAWLEDDPAFFPLGEQRPGPFSWCVLLLVLGRRRVVSSSSGLLVTTTCVALPACKLLYTTTYSIDLGSNPMFIYKYPKIPIPKESIWSETNPQNRGDCHTRSALRLLCFQVLQSVVLKQRLNPFPKMERSCVQLVTKWNNANSWVDDVFELDLTSGIVILYTHN